MRLLRRRRPAEPPQPDRRPELARRIAGQYAIAEASPLAYYAATGELPATGPGQLLEEIEWARAWPWIEPEHLRDLTWLADYLVD